MDDLVAFLSARLDEDEEVAKAAGPVTGRWCIDSEGHIQDEETGGGGSAYVAVGPWDGPVHERCAIHIARYDPARVLAEVAAKRAILAEHEPEPWGDPHPELSRCAPGHGDGGSGWWTTWPCIEVRAIAAVYSDHPGYRPEWKP